MSISPYNDTLISVQYPYSSSNTTYLSCNYICSLKKLKSYCSLLQIADSNKLIHKFQFNFTHYYTTYTSSNISYKSSNTTYTTQYNLFKFQLYRQFEEDKKCWMILILSLLRITNSIKLIQQFQFNLHILQHNLYML